MTLLRPRALPLPTALLACMAGIEDDRGEPLEPIEGMAPDLTDPPPGCRFAPRCPQAQDRCRAEEQHLSAISATQEVACILVQAEMAHG